MPVRKRVRLIITSFEDFIYSSAITYSNHSFVSYCQVQKQSVIQLFVIGCNFHKGGACIKQTKLEGKM